MKKLALIIGLILVFSFGKPIFAYSSEVCNVNPSYAHPITGKIEDSGNSPEIGQSMTESVVYPQGLVEEKDGKYYLSVRYGLADNIKNERFYVQNSSSGKFYNVNFEIVKSSNDTKDFRFEIPSKNAVIKTSFYVEAMGRDIVFFYSLSNFVFGNTDFELMSEEKVLENEDSKTLSKELNEHNESMLKQHNLVESTEVEDNSKISVEELGYDHGLLMKDDIDLNYKSSEKNLKDEDEDLSSSDMGDWTSIFVNLIIIIVGVTTGILLVVSYISHIVLKKLKYENEILMEEFYEE